MTNSAKIIDHLDFILLDILECKRLLLSKKQDPPPNQPVPGDHIYIRKLNIPGIKHLSRIDITVNVDNVLNMTKSYSQGNLGSLRTICQHFIKFLTIRLDGQTRLSLLNEQGGSIDLLKPPNNHLTALFQDDKARENIREITKDAFGLYFTIDPTKPGFLRVKMHTRLPKDKEEEQSYDKRAREFHSDGISIEELSDGVKAFTGLSAVIMSTDFKIMLIDEAEAFLHPPLARKLGTQLANLSSKQNTNIFAATHSPFFIMGCIQSGKPLNVVRLTYRDKIPSATLLENKKLQEMMREPLLRSTGILNALFHSGIIVTEGNSDRAFYQEINERLLLFGQGGIDDCLFLNAVGKQTLYRIVLPLREMRIPAAAIVDLDIIKKADDFNKLLGACGIPNEMHTSLVKQREEVLAAFNKLNKDPKKFGVKVLDESTKESFENLAEMLSKYGFFIVEVGELEGWLTTLGISSGNKNIWLINIFQRLGADPDDDSYVKPEDNNVWAFVNKIGEWINNPKRKGMNL